MSFQIHKKHLPGLACVLLLTAVSYGLSLLPLFSQWGINSLIIAILLGMFAGNIFSVPDTLTPGMQYAAKQILRTAIVLYGFRVSIQDIAALGSQALILDAAVVTLTLYLGYQIGTRLLKLDRELSLLISAGAAICGAAAVLAAEDVIKSEPYKTAVAVGTVVLFGTISMFLYPAMQRAGLLGLTETQFGYFAGASVHEVAQAMVAGSSIAPVVGKTAVVVKMIRVLMLVPVLLVLSAWKSAQAPLVHGHRKKIMVPWFAVMFLLVIVFNSLHVLPPSMVEGIKQIDIILLTMAMGAIGFETKYSKIKKVGIKPLYLAFILFIWLMSFAAMTVKMI